jgi:hypothetical protein
MFHKPAMMLENSNDFEEGYGITFQNYRWRPECLNNHFKEGLSKDLKISKCSHRNKPKLFLLFPHQKAAKNNLKTIGACAESTDLMDLQKNYSSRDTIH